MAKGAGVVVLVVIAVFLLLDALVYFFGFDSRDGERSDQHERHAGWIDEAADRRAGLASTMSAPVRHVGSFLRDGVRDTLPAVPSASRPISGSLLPPGRPRGATGRAGCWPGRNQPSRQPTSRTYSS